MATLHPKLKLPQFLKSPHFQVSESSVAIDSLFLQRMLTFEGLVSLWNAKIRNLEKIKSLFSEHSFQIPNSSETLGALWLKRFYPTDARIQVLCIELIVLAVYYSKDLSRI